MNNFDSANVFQKAPETKSPPQIRPEKTSITCSNLPESLFDIDTAKRHFGKFGRVTKMLMRLKQKECVIEYDSYISASKALLNAGAFDGFMFDVTWTKKNRRKSKTEDDPDWLPDTDVEEELEAMGTNVLPRTTRNRQSIDHSNPISSPVPTKELDNPTPVMRQIRKLKEANALKAKNKHKIPTLIVTNPSEQQVAVAVPSASTSSTITTYEAALELHQIWNRVSKTADEQRRTLDVRDRILRSWGGAGSRVKVGGATVGTCPDMCPEKEVLQRQAEHQVISYEMSSGTPKPELFVKQYSRSSADQEVPMCYELRPAPVLTRTANYLLTHIVPLYQDSSVSLADWFHFLWDRLRGIRKDVTQQALCCQESVHLVEQCARFHAHCAARLVTLHAADFDQRLNTDNLTKCLQTLKHMYTDLSGKAHMKPCEAEFRGYVALLNMKDTNFWWEIQKLPSEIQKSEPIMFAIEIFTAMDNNNYVRFFRLVRQKATYIQACILLRYFNDVRARALARLVKAYAPRGDAKFPAEEMCTALAFEDLDSLQLFVENYGLTLGEGEDSEPYVVLNKQEFIEDSDPFPIERAPNLVESKMNKSLSEVLAGGKLPDVSYEIQTHSSFDKNGYLKEDALVAQDQGYNTKNDTDKDLNELINELRNLKDGIKPLPQSNNVFKGNVFAPKQEASKVEIPSKTFSFAPAIQVTGNSPPKELFSNTNTTNFTFSKPGDSKSPPGWQKKISSAKDEYQEPSASFTQNVFQKGGNLFTNNKGLFTKSENTGKIAYNLFGNANSTVFKKPDGDNVFKQPSSTNIFSNKPFTTKESANKTIITNKSNVFEEQSVNIFGDVASETNINETNLFKKPMNQGSSLFNNKPETNIFAKSLEPTNIFGKPSTTPATQSSSNIFTSSTIKKNSIFGDSKPPQNKADSKNLFGSTNQNLFKIPEKDDSKNIFSGASSNKSVAKSSTNLFSNATQSVSQSTNIFSNAVSSIMPQSSIFGGSGNLVNATFGSLVQGEQQNHTESKQEQERKRLEEEKLKQTERIDAQRKLEEQRQLEEQRLAEQRRLEEQRRQQEQKRLEEQIRIEEIRRQEELKRKMEEERRIAEQKRLDEEIKQKKEEARRRAEEERRIAEEARRKAEEERRKLLEQIDSESKLTSEELTEEIINETVDRLLQAEIIEYNNLVDYTISLTEQLINEVSSEICYAELKSERHLSSKLIKKYGKKWRKNSLRNRRRRKLVDDTPAWLQGLSPEQAAKRLCRNNLYSALTYMHSIHQGHKFKGELTPSPTIKPYNLTETVRASLLKRHKQLQNTTCDCIYWKITIANAGSKKWLRHDLEIDDWIKLVFNKNSIAEEKILHLCKSTWDNFIQFAISITVYDYNDKNFNIFNGTNGLLVFLDNNDNVREKIEAVLNEKLPVDLVPMAVISLNETSEKKKEVERILNNYINRITAFKIYSVDRLTPLESVDFVTKCALKWLAKELPSKPPIEIDLLKQFLHNTVGNEFWYRLRLERKSRMDIVFRDVKLLCLLYNNALDKIIGMIADEMIPYYQNFPSELKQFLPYRPYPRSYEYFPNNWMSETNKVLVENEINSLRLPEFETELKPKNYQEFQLQLQSLCDELGWFDTYEQINYKLISVLPNEFSNFDLSLEEFTNYFQMYDFLDIFHLLTSEKIESVNPSAYVVYDKLALQEYRQITWWRSIIFSNYQDAIEFETDNVDDSVESFVNTPKRVRYSNISDDSLHSPNESECCKLVNTTIEELNNSLAKFNDCSKRINKLESQLENQVEKANELETLLQIALRDD